MNEWSKWLHGPGAKKQMPYLFSGKVTLVAPGSKTYNCFAASVGVFNKQINPITHQLDHIKFFKGFYAKHGYELMSTNDTMRKAGIEKIALLLGKNPFLPSPEITHAALQLPNGKWLHKLGEGPMITTDSLEQVMYGDFGSEISGVFEKKISKRQYAPKGFRVPR